MECQLCGAKLHIPANPKLGDIVRCKVCGLQYRYIKAGKDITVREVK